MLTTYTLYMRGDGFGPRAFEPVMCESRTELMSEVNAVLARHPACEAIDVCLGEELLFTVGQRRKR